MIERTFDHMRPYRYVMYARMSSATQNERSPEQQFHTIQETVQRLGYPWQCVKTYRDNAMSGRFITKRVDFMKMIQSIQAESTDIDLILVDTMERFGRSEDDDYIRSDLARKDGVYVLAADNQFANATGIAGKATRFVEHLRTTEHTRIQSHNVKRGKKDAVRQGRWPGGKPPFGYRLKRIEVGENGNKKPYNVIELDPRESPVLKRAFERAAETGEGCQRLAQWWNEDPDIPEEFKPMFAPTMTYRLKNTIAIGTLLWGAKSRDIVNDTRITEKNPNGPDVFPNFCPPIVSEETFQKVQRMYEVRSADYLAKRQAKSKHDAPTKLIKPLAPGLTLKYLLTGLVRCGLCNGSMRAIPLGPQEQGQQGVYLLLMPTTP